MLVTVPSGQIGHTLGTPGLQHLKKHSCDRPPRSHNGCCDRCLIVSKVPNLLAGRRQTVW